MKQLIMLLILFAASIAFAGDSSNTPVPPHELPALKRALVDGLGARLLYCRVKRKQGNVISDSYLHMDKVLLQNILQNTTTAMVHKRRFRKFIYPTIITLDSELPYKSYYLMAELNRDRMSIRSISYGEYKYTYEYKNPYPIDDPQFQYVKSKVLVRSINCD